MRKYEDYFISSNQWYQLFRNYYPEIQKVFCIKELLECTDPSYRVGIYSKKFNFDIPSPPESTKPLTIEGRNVSDYKEAIMLMCNRNPRVIRDFNGIDLNTIRKWFE